MAATDQQIRDAALDAVLDILETGEVYDIDGVHIERDLSRVNEIRRQFEREAAGSKPALTLLRRRRA